MNILIDFELAERNSVRADATKAFNLLTNGDVGTVITIFPQALNPLLKSLEATGNWKKVVVVPTADSFNKPLYMVINVGDRMVKEIKVSE